MKPWQGSASLQNHYRDLVRAGQYLPAYSVISAYLMDYPQDAVAQSNAAACCIYFNAWPMAIRHGQAALDLDPNDISALDAMAHAAYMLGQMDRAALFGRRALELRDRSIPKIVELSPNSQPEALTGSHKIISFSLFGDNPRYCETAIKNCEAQPQIYPGWTCRFYLDRSVPSPIRHRIEVAGAQLVDMDDAAENIPPTMWRFLSWDDAEIAIFRDADSLISAREAHAVEEWLESGRDFHIMRDFGSHTELMMAGMWGVRHGALPSFDQLFASFQQLQNVPPRFADQIFLRLFVWPYARKSQMSHDSVFGFGEHRPFPDGPPDPRFHVGANLGGVHR